MTTDGLHVRHLHWRDIAALVPLEDALFGADAWSEPTWWAELAARPRRRYLVLADETAGTSETGSSGRVAAYGGIDLGGDVADLMTLAVDPAYQGRGLGTRLLGVLESDAAAGRAQHLILEVRADNAAALRLYQRTGYTRISIRRRYYQPGDVDAHILRKALT